MEPAARIGDPHLCPRHGSGTLGGTCCGRVLIGNARAMRQGDGAPCNEAPAATIASGAPSVHAEGRPLARRTDKTSDGGRILGGFPTVLVGERTPADAALLGVPLRCIFLMKGLDAMPVEGFDRLRSPVSLSDPMRDGIMFPGETEPRPANVYWATVRGHRVKIVEPLDPAENGQWTPTAPEVAQSLGTLSDQQLAKLNEVVICPRDRPDKPSTVADALDGRVRLFPRSEAKSQGDLDWVLQHEATHISDEGPWHKDPAFRKRWEEAMKADSRSPTDYAKNNPREDRADMTAIYALVVGTPCEAAARKLFPHRMAELDRAYPNGFPRRR